MNGHNLLALVPSRHKNTRTLVTVNILSAQLAEIYVCMYIQRRNLTFPTFIRCFTEALGSFKNSACLLFCGYLISGPPYTHDSTLTQTEPPELRNKNKRVLHARSS